MKHEYSHGQEDVDEEVAAATSDERRRRRGEQNSNLYPNVSGKCGCWGQVRTTMRRTSEPRTILIVNLDNRRCA